MEGSNSGKSLTRTGVVSCSLVSPVEFNTLLVPGGAQLAEAVVHI